MADQTNDALRAAGMMFEEIASLASDTDSHCYQAHGELISSEVDLEAISQELVHLRDVICRIGWMADHATSTLRTGSAARGDAEAWMLGPLTRRALAACRAKP